MRWRAGISGVLLGLLVWTPVAAGSQVRLEGLPVITTIAYVTAHPDDESGPVIAYFARGLGARVVLLCLTRGEGGQNTYGPELGEELGRLRTAELEAAARIYGAEVRFLDAPDFGYSKSVEETLERWEQAAVVERLVRALRELKPDVVLARWTPEAPAGAQHQAAGVVTREAFALVGRADAFPEQAAEGLEPWPVRYLVSHAFGAETSPRLRVPTDETDPETGKSFDEIGWDGIRQHRTQGLDRLPREAFLSFRGRSSYLQVDARRLNAPEPAEARALVQTLEALPVVFPTVGWLAEWEERLQASVAEVREAAARVRAGDRGWAARQLAEAAVKLEPLRAELAEQGARQAPPAAGILAERQAAWVRAAAELAGLTLAAVAARPQVSPGDTLGVRVTVSIDTAEAWTTTGLAVRELRLAAPPGWRVEEVTREATAGLLVRDFRVTLPEAVGALPARAPLAAEALLAPTKSEPVAGPAGGGAGELRVPVRVAVRAAGNDGAAPLMVVPRVAVELAPALRLVPMGLAATSVDWEVRVESAAAAGPLVVSLEGPPGWLGPLPRRVESRPGVPVRLPLSVLLPERLEPGRQTVRAEVCLPSSADVPPSFAHPLPCAEREVVARAEARAEVMDVAVPRGLRIGYIGFNDDPVPPLLAQLGIGVDMLDAVRLARERLERYDAVVVAERAYDFRADLPGATPRLLDYVKRGGTLVIQHQGARAWQAHQPAPYPASMPERPNLRVTREDAPVRVLIPDHPVLNFPHRIGPADFTGWVQERGLYFVGEWDVAYQTPLEMADPGEEPLRGGLLVARLGEGVYIYTGLALFRQVRAGVGGGVRLFVNLLSQGRQAK